MRFLNKLGEAVIDHEARNWGAIEERVSSESNNFFFFLGGVEGTFPIAS